MTKHQRVSAQVLTMNTRRVCEQVLEQELVARSLIGGRGRSSQAGSVGSAGFQLCRSLEDFINLKSNQLIPMALIFTRRDVRSYISLSKKLYSISMLQE